MTGMKTIQLPPALYDEVARRAEEAGYDTPDEFVAFLCRAGTWARPDSSGPSPASSTPKLDPEAEKRLKQLGYR